MHSIFKNRTKIILLFFIIVFIFSGCSISKENQSIENYLEKINYIVNDYNYNIEVVSSDNSSYSIQMKNKNQSIELKIELHENNQFNSFEIICENPTSFDEILKITNNISRKSFSEKTFHNIINTDDNFYNINENSIDKELYQFYKIDYVGISADYCIQYYSFTTKNTVLLLSGFTK